MTLQNQADSFLKGKQISFSEANALWKALKKADDLSVARQTLEHMHESKALIDGLPSMLAERRVLCCQLALLTSKDPELPASMRHDTALGILAELYDLDDEALDGNAEVLGIAAGILKRRWQDLGQLQDLQDASRFYTRGAGKNMGEDAYAHINAAFLDDLLAQTGDDTQVRRQRAQEMRQRIVCDLPVIPSWFNTASRAEAFFGLRRYKEATDILVAGISNRPEPWELRTTITQLGQLAYLHEPSPMDVPAIRDFFTALLPGNPDAALRAGLGKIGLALSGGGFRASFYHLGVLARLAELDLLRHVEVLSCVSGGSIVGACYWLALRRRLLNQNPMTKSDYVTLVQELITHFKTAVDDNLRAQIQPSKAMALWHLLTDAQGAMEPEKVAPILDNDFYRPLVPDAESGTIMLDQLNFTPADHDPALSGSSDFNPSKHNWLRAHKVPALVLNATSVNTGHAWQFTTKWMGESPWSVHEEADSVPRLEWAQYTDTADWRMELGRAVAASACVPGVFNPLSINGKYHNDVHVQLVDGGVHDNQGTVSLLAMNCNIVLVSDACGQLLFQTAPTHGIKGLLSYAKRSMDVLMERIRQANFSDLQARKNSGQLRAFMFLHMKAGLESEVIPRLASQLPHTARRSAIAPSGVRVDFQRALAELRTDLNSFTENESTALMACGYQMAAHAVKRDLANIPTFAQAGKPVAWPFEKMLEEITSTADNTPRREELLKAFREGSSVKFSA